MPNWFGCFCLAALSAGMAAAAEPVDRATVARIRQEALQSSRVMEHAFFLTDVHGPRLTGSPGFRAAGEWAAARLQEYGLHVSREPFAWGRSWSCRRFSAQMLEPRQLPLIAVAAPWSPSTSGILAGAPLHAPLPGFRAAPAEYEKFFARHRRQVRGRILLASDLTPPRPDRPFSRLTDAQLAAGDRPRAPQPDPTAAPPASFDEIEALEGRLDQFLRDEGVAALLLAGRGRDGTDGTDGPWLARAQAADLRDPKRPLPPPTIVVSPEQYNYLVRLVQKGVRVKVAVELDAEFHNDPDAAFNLVAEMPGGAKKDEVVMLGAHLDSWTAATGATDNAEGCAVVMEAMRILQALGRTPERTIRMALWGGHEGAGEGARTYVRKHFGDPNTGLRAGHAKLSGYFNLDNGHGKIRGIYLQGNEAVRSIFAAWLEPFHDLGATALWPGRTGGTDHSPFDEIGLPGFQFIQDPLDGARTHHSNMDFYDRLQPEDLQQAAAVMASFAWHAAMREELLPRLPRKPTAAR